MSLILEALRKSEQQRRLGESPTLVSESAWATRRMQAAPTRRGRWLWLLLIVVLAGAAAAAWYFGRPSLAAIDPTLQPPATAAAPLPLPLSTPATVERAPSAAATATPAPTTAALIAEPIAAAAIAPQGSDAMLAATDGREPAAITAQEPQATMAINPQPLFPPPAPAALAAASAIALPQPAPPAAAVAAPDTAPLAAGAAPGPANAPPSAIQTPTAAPAPGDLPYFYELALATRQALPAMQVTMHVWNADPTRRFVILDGVRASEGEPAGDSMTVLEIRRDGVVLDFRGTRFVLPNGGS